MPIFEGVCGESTCRLHGRRQEHYYHNREQPSAPCDSCGGPTERLAISRANIVFTGAITARYNDRTKENAHLDGHTAWRRKSAKDPNKPEPVRIETWEDQKRFCKEEGLLNPKDVGNNYEVAPDGRTVLSPMGLPGVEI